MNSSRESRIRPATAADAEGIAHLYNHYVANTVISFEVTEVGALDMEQRIARVTQQFPWLVSETDNGRDFEISGFAYANWFRERIAYRHSVETTVYLSHSHCGQGIGSMLYTALFEQLQPLNLHTAIAAIALPNSTSVRLHEKFGFVKTGVLAQVGFKFNQWIDVGYWQKIL